MKQEKELKPFSTKKIVVDEIDKVVFGKFGFKDENKNIVIEAQYASCGEFSCGLCPVAYQSWYHTPEGKRYYEMHWGYIDQSGKEKIPFRFRDARDFNRYGVAAVCDEYDEGYYLIDTHGRKLLSGKNINAQHLYEPEDRFLEFTKGEEDDIWPNNVGAYDTKKKKIFLDPHYWGIHEHSEECILVYESGSFYGADFMQHYINSKGEELYPGLVGKGFNIVGIPNKDGYSIVAIFEFVEASGEISGTTLGRYNKNYYRIWHYGVSTLAGDLIIPAEYDRIIEQKNGKFVCTKDGQEQVIVLKKPGM